MPLIMLPNLADPFSNNCFMEYPPKKISKDGALLKLMVAPNVIKIKEFNSKKRIMTLWYTYELNFWGSLDFIANH